VVERNCANADERRELARRPPSRKIHLKEAVLGMEKTEGLGDVFARGAPDRWNAEVVALDRYRRAQASDLSRAFELWQARSNLPTRPQRARNPGDQDYDERDEQHFGETAHAVRHVITTASSG
jgi:hypothetical protein